MSSHSWTDTQAEDPARIAPAAERNRDPILAVLRQWLKPNGSVLEIASGTGQHAVWFATALPGVVWQPSDADPVLLASIAAWRDRIGPANLLPVLGLDATAPDSWPVRRADAVVAINMIHIAPWAATVGLMDGASRVLSEDGLLYLYGPFREGGAHTAPSNEAFDDGLRGRDPAWGVRDLEEVVRTAETYGLKLAARIAMPANNLSLIFSRPGSAPEKAPENAQDKAPESGQGVPPT